MQDKVPDNLSTSYRTNSIANGAQVYENINIIANNTCMEYLNNTGDGE
jgi:hypothetical protein